MSVPTLERAEIPVITPAGAISHRGLLVPYPEREAQAATLAIDETFAVAAIVAELRAKELLKEGEQPYWVIFRSLANDGLTDEQRRLVSHKDLMATEEGFTLTTPDGKRRALFDYYGGNPDQFGFCMSTCMWLNQELAEAAVDNPAHQAAAAMARVAYRWFDIECYRVVPQADGTVVLEQVKGPSWPNMVQTIGGLAVERMDELDFSGAVYL